MQMRVDAEVIGSDTGEGSGKLLIQQAEGANMLALVAVAPNGTEVVVELGFINAAQLVAHIGHAMTVC